MGTSKLACHRDTVTYGHSLALRCEQALRPPAHPSSPSFVCGQLADDSVFPILTRLSMDSGRERKPRSPSPNHLELYNPFLQYQSPNLTTPSYLFISCFIYTLDLVQSTSLVLTILSLCDGIVMSGYTIKKTSTGPTYTALRRSFFRPFTAMNISSARMYFDFSITSRMPF